MWTEVYLDVVDVRRPGGRGAGECYALGATRWDCWVGVPWDWWLRCTMAPGVYRGPPEVYRGPCMKITCLNTHITYTADKVLPSHGWLWATELAVECVMSVTCGLLPVPLGCRVWHGVTVRIGSFLVAKFIFCDSYAVLRRRFCNHYKLLSMAVARAIGCLLPLTTFVMGIRKLGCHRMYNW